MPALILFSSSGSSGSEGGLAKGRLRVKESAKDVVEKLGSAKNGFADFSLHNKPNEKVWVNRDQVRMIRSG